MNHPLKWIQKQTKLRPFLSALVVLLLIIVPGYFRIENAVSHTNTNTQQLGDVTRAQTQQVKQTSLINCQTRNTAQRNSRDRFNQLFNAIDVILTSSPSASPQQQQATHAFVDQLRKAIPLDPTVEDIDCNGDGQLTIADYG